MIDAGDFLLQAQSLLNKRNVNEVDMRSSISRAYYSLYHESYKFLRSNYRKDLIAKIKETLSHSPRRSYYTNDETDRKIDAMDIDFILSSGISLHQIIPQVLRSLNQDCFMEFKEYRKKRNDADYNIEKGIKYEDATTIVESISNLIQSIKKL
jgi:uncharacterized protein (UPF0332 family)